MRLGGYQGPASVHTRAGQVFGQALKRELGDRVDYFFDSNVVERDLKAADLLTMVEAGDLEGCYFSSSYLAKRVPELGVFDQHFVVPDRHRAYNILDGALGGKLKDFVADKTGYRVLDYWDNGFRHISNGRRAIRMPADCQGLTIRTLANDNHQRVFRALGFEPMAIDVRDLPEAVRSGRVDAQENPLTNIYNFQLHRDHKHITLTRHLLGVALALFNKEAVDSWPADVQDGVVKALGEATQAQRRFADDDDRICREKLSQEGVDIHDLTLEEHQAFADATRQAVEHTRAEFDASLIDLFDTDLAT